MTSFYLNPYDDVTQKLEEYSSKAIYTQGAICQVTKGTNIQRTNVNKLWSHCIDDWANIQKSPAALPINPDPGCVLRSTIPSKWIRVQEGSFLRHLHALGALSADAGWATTGFWGSQFPFFLIHYFAFKLTFWAVLLRSFGQSFMICQGYCIQNNCSISYDTIWFHWQNRQYTQLTDLLLQLHSRFLHLLQLKTWPLPLLLLYT